MGDLDVACLLVYANRITVPPAGNESISLNIEHTRPLKYKIEMSRVDTKLVGNIPVATTTSATAGFATDTGCDQAVGSAGSLLSTRNPLLQRRGPSL